MPIETLESKKTRKDLQPKKYEVFMGDVFDKFSLKLREKIEPLAVQTLPPHRREDYYGRRLQKAASQVVEVAKEHGIESNGKLSSIVQEFHEKGDQVPAVIESLKEKGDYLLERKQKLESLKIEKEKPRVIKEETDIEIRLRMANEMDQSTNFTAKDALKRIGRGMKNMVNSYPREIITLRSEQMGDNIKLDFAAMNVAFQEAYRIQDVITRRKFLKLATAAGLGLTLGGPALVYYMGKIT